MKRLVESIRVAAARRTGALWLACGIAAWATVVSAEPPSTSFMFPAGGQRGTQVAVRVGGHYLHERAGFELLGPGISGPNEIVRTTTTWFEGPLVRLPGSQRQEDYPQDYAATIAIAADAPLGVRYWRVTNAQGATAARKFIVGDLPEVIEDEIDGDPIPTLVKLPVTINGRLFPREDVDVWTFEATAGARLTIATAAAAIGSPLEARVEVRDPAGRKLADASAPTGQDPQVHFTAATSGTYQVRVQDARYEGLQNFVYRVTITDAPWIDAVYPLGGRRGEEVEFQVLGQALPDGKLRLRLPSTPDSTLVQRFEIAGRTTNPVSLELSDAAEVLEVEPNQTAEQARPIVATSVANGRIDQPGDVDMWAVELEKGAELNLAIVASRLGSPLDSRLILRDATGKELARGDDGPSGSPDAQLKFTAPVAGKVFVEVSERFSGRGGPTFAYRLIASAARPTVRLELAADVVTVDRGGQQKLAVTVTREAGFAGPVTVTAQGLPAGVVAPEVTVAANQNRGELVFKAEPTAAVAATRIRLVGRYELDGKAVEAPIAMPRRADELPLDEVLLAVALPTPFKFQGAYELIYIPCGAVSRKRYAIERNGYAGPLVVQLADRQTRHLQGVTGPVLTVPAEANEFVYPITLPSWMELGRTSRVVLMATGEVDDGTGHKQKVCFTSGDQNNQMVNLVSPSPLRVTLDRASLAAPASGEVSVQVVLRRDPSIQSAARVELLTPRHMRGIAADPIEIPSGSTEGRLTLRFAPESGPFNMPVLIRAIALRGNDPLVAESPLEIVRP